MGINQLGAFGINPSPRTLFVNSNGTQQQTAVLNGGVLQFTLKATQAVHVPAGNFLVQAGAYSNIQQWDSTSYVWRFLSAFDQVPYMVSSDGSNLQVCNTTGGIIAACVTNKGTAGAATLNGFYGYNQAQQFVQIINGVTTTGLTTSTAQVSATTTGGALLNTFVGGSVNTTVTITNGGSGFLEAPNLIVVPPSTQGNQPYIPATMTCTISSGVINAVTVTNQGAGYVGAPTVLVVNQEGDLTGTYSTAVLTATLTNSGQISAVTVASPGTATFTSVPTITFGGTSAPASAAATALMNFSITALAVNAAGAGYGNAQQTITWATNTTALPTPTNTNPAIELGAILNPAQPYVQAISQAGGTITGNGTILFGGYGFYSVPLAQMYGTTTLETTRATWTVTAGGNPDNIYLYPI